VRLLTLVAIGLFTLVLASGLEADNSQQTGQKTDDNSAQLQQKEQEQQQNQQKQQQKQQKQQHKQQKQQQKKQQKLNTDKKTCWLCNPKSPATYKPENDRKTGEVLRGPRTVIANDLNTLRYEYIFNTTTTYQKTPDVWTTLSGMNLTLPSASPNVSGQSGKTKARATPVSGGVPITQEYPSEVQALLDRFAAIQDEDAQRFTTLDGNNSAITTNLSDLGRLQGDANTAISGVTSAGSNLTTFISNTTGAADELIPAISRQLADPIYRSGLSAQWPRFESVARVQTAATSMKNVLISFKVLYDPFVLKQTAALALLKQDCQTMVDTLKKQKSVDQPSVTALNDEIQEIGTEQTALTDNASLLQWEIAQNDVILAALPDLLPSSSKYDSFQKNQAVLANWQGRMTDKTTDYAAFIAGQIKQNPFQKQTTSGCEFSFGGGRTNDITLSRRDLLPGSAANNSETVLSVSVQCTSPISISAGVGFDTIGERTFGIQAVPSSAGSTSTTNVFVVTSQSSFHPVPIGMAHARLCEFGNTASLHFSFGIAAGIKSQDAGGSSAEFLIGPSLALFRTVFLTPGLYLGQTASLSVFKVGDPVPSNVTSPPLKTSYTPGFGFAITFTKP
jgi:hypothetical protein